MHVTGRLIPNITQTEIDSLINNLAVDLSDFSRFICADGRMFGVKTDCDTCDLDIVECVRKDLAHQLITSQLDVEAKLGYPITDRYVDEYVDLHDDLIKLKYPFVSKLNVEERYTLIGKYVLSPYILPSVLLADSGLGFCYVELDTVVKNPNKVKIFYNGNEVLKSDGDGTYPKRVGGKWRIAIDNQTISLCTERVDVSYCSLVYIDIPDCVGTVVPVYSGGKQHVPQARDSEIVSTGVRRFWFNLWEFVDADFQDEQTNLSAGEFWKLNLNVDFYCVTEVATVAQLYCKDGCDEEAPVEVTLEIIDKDNGLVKICNVDACTDGCSDLEKSRLRVKYKVSYKDCKHTLNFTEICEAIIYLSAANLQLSGCSCKIEKGLIADAQKAYYSSRTDTFGNTSVDYRYGSLHGHFRFREIMDRTSSYSRSAII